MKVFSSELKKMLTDCSPTYRAVIATLEYDVIGLSSDEKLSRIEKFTSTGDLDVLSVKSAHKLDELNEQFGGDPKKLVLHIIEALATTS